MFGGTVSFLVCSIVRWISRVCLHSTKFGSTRQKGKTHQRAKAEKRKRRNNGSRALLIELSLKRRNVFLNVSRITSISSFITAFIYTTRSLRMSLSVYWLG